MLVNCSSLFGNLDSLKRFYNNAVDTNSVLASFKIGKHFLSSNMDSAIYYYRSRVELAEKLDYTHGRKLAYRSLGVLEFRKDSRFEESIAWLEKGMQLVEEKNLPPGDKVDLLTNYGVVYHYWDKIGEAIEKYVEAVEICRSSNLQSREGRLLNNLGIFYRKLKEYDKAIDIYQQSYALRAKLKDTMGMANNLLNMAPVYGKNKAPQKSLEVLDWSSTIWKKMTKP